MKYSSYGHCRMKLSFAAAVMGNAAIWIGF